MDTVTFQLVLGIIFLIMGIGLIYWMSRRKFNSFTDKDYQINYLK